MNKLYRNNLNVNRKFWYLRLEELNENRYLKGGF